MELSGEIIEFHNQLFDWWADNKRKLPWRDTQDPYKIMIAEFMLQQTQVSRVIPKYLQFIKTFSNLQALADANQSDVIALWQGLGYNKRAIWLQEAAGKLLEYEQFPTDWKKLIKIKGIGNYTARSILIFSFNLNYAAVDTNIKRIYLHKGWIYENMAPKEIQNFADGAIPINKSRDYHNALMDYGSLYLTAKKTGIRTQNKQKPFKGSKRQIRGEIVKLLIETPELSFIEIKERITSEVNDKKLKQCLKDLENDGMVNFKDNAYYSLPE